jgi:N-methylhydantoinase B
MAFVAPVFAGGTIVAFAGSIAHKADLGGTVAGSTSANATEMYHEGLLIPPIKIWDAGRPLADIERLILSNSRQPALVRGDMNAQIAVTQMGATRVKELCERFGAETLCNAFAAILKAAADGLRAAVARLPTGGTASAEGLLDSDGVVVDRPIKLAVTVAVENDIVAFDFTASDPQASGPVNLRPSMVEACVFYCLIGCLDPKLAFNDGMRDVVRFVFAPRTVVNAEPPAAVSNYQMVNLKLVDVILEALSKFHPARAIANAGSSSALGIAWRRGRPGQSTMQYEIIGSAYGGGMGHDGTSATATH